LQHAGKTEDGVGRHPLRGLEFAHGIKGTIDVCLPVDEKNSLVLECCHEATVAGAPLRVKETTEEYDTKGKGEGIFVFSCAFPLCA
jgi:hypothetical protein